MRENTMKKVVKKLMVLVYGLMTFSVFCLGCFTALAVEIGDNIFNIGIVASITTLVFGFICIIFNREV